MTSPESTNVPLSFESALDLTVGGWVAIYVAGLGATQVIQGKLLAIWKTDAGVPVAIQVEQPGKEWKLNVPWGQVMMITQTAEPVQVEQPNVDLEQLQEFIKSQGIEVPAEAQEWLDSQVDAELAD